MAKKDKNRISIDEIYCRPPMKNYESNKKYIIILIKVGPLT